jgi:hypothetical protein
MKYMTMAFSQFVLAMAGLLVPLIAGAQDATTPLERFRKLEFPPRGREL